MPFSYVHHPRHKAWSALLDLGETRLRASIQYSTSSHNPNIQKSIEEYCVEIDRWLVSLLEELSIPEAAISKIVALLGSVELSLHEFEVLTERSASSSSSSAESREVD